MTDFHVHTHFCDGKKPPEQYVLAAIEKGMPRLGLVCHSYTDFDTSYCAAEHAVDFRAEISRLKEVYRDKIELLCGVELDAFSCEDAALFDYAIGAVHYVESRGERFTVDYSAQEQEKLVRAHFGGDFYAFVEAYYRAVARIAQKPCDLIAHFDLVSKFNEGGVLFDENHPRHIAAWQAAAEQLLALGVPFELNTGAICRGYRTTPYPAQPIANWLAARGARFVLSSDAHAPEGIGFGFAEWEKVCGKDLQIVDFHPRKRAR